MLKFKTVLNQKKKSTKNTAVLDRMLYLLDNDNVQTKTDEDSLWFSQCEKNNIVLKDWSEWAGCNIGESKSSSWTIFEPDFATTNPNLINLCGEGYHIPTYDEWLLAYAIITDIIPFKEREDRGFWWGTEVYDEFRNNSRSSIDYSGSRPPASDTAARKFAATLNMWILGLPNYLTTSYDSKTNKYSLYPGYITIVPSIGENYMESEYWKMVKLDGIEKMSAPVAWTAIGYDMNPKKWFIKWFIRCKKDTNNSKLDKLNIESSKDTVNIWESVDIVIKAIDKSGNIIKDYEWSVLISVPSNSQDDLVFPQAMTFEKKWYYLRGLWFWNTAREVKFTKENQWVITVKNVFTAKKRPDYPFITVYIVSNNQPYISANKSFKVLSPNWLVSINMNVYTNFEYDFYDVGKDLNVSLVFLWEDNNPISYEGTVVLESSDPNVIISKKQIMVNKGNTGTVNLWRILKFKKPWNYTIKITDKSWQVFLKDFVEVEFNVQ